jgi:hypothetical protein
MQSNDPGAVGFLGQQTNATSLAVHHALLEHHRRVCDHQSVDVMLRHGAREYAATPSRKFVTGIDEHSARCDGGCPNPNGLLHALLFGYPFSDWTAGVFPAIRNDRRSIVRTTGQRKLTIHAGEGPWQRCLVRVWPFKHERVSWPPPKSFSDLGDGLRDLRRTFRRRTWIGRNAQVSKVAGGRGSDL